MANRITTLFDLDTKGFDSGLKKLRGEVAKADGIVGKLKTAGSGLGTILQDNIAGASLAAGTALVAFGVKSVKAFQDTALAAGAFADATGTSVEAASRLIEVSGDIGIEAGTVETALGKMNKTLGASPNLFNMLGVQIAKTATGATDVNGTFLNVVDRLNAIKDPAEKARVATQLLGRDWQSMAELIAQGSGKLKQSMADVQSGKVISPEELKKARELRASFDDLNDSIENIALTIGAQLAPAAKTAAGVLSGVVENVDKVKFEDSHWYSFLTDSLPTQLGKIKDHFVNTYDGIFNSDQLEKNNANLKHRAEILEAQASMTAHLADVTTEATQTEKELSDSLKVAQTELQSYYDALSNEQAFNDLISSLGEATARLQDSSVSAVEQASDLNKAKRAVIEYAKQVGDIPLSRVTEILATLNSGDYKAAADALERLAAPRKAAFQIQLSTVSIGNQLVGAGLRNEMEGRNAGKSAADAFASGFAKGAKDGGGGGGGGSTVRTPAQVMADWDQVFANLYKLGEWDLARYRSMLQRRLGEYAKYSDDYMRVWSELRSLDEQEQQRKDDAAKAEKERLANVAQAEQERLDNQHALGDISDADYIASLQKRMMAYDRYSNEYVAIWKTIQDLQQKEFDKQEEIRKAEQDRLDEVEKARQREIDAEKSKLAASRGGALGILTINITNTAADPQSVVRAIEQARRLYGSRWLTN